jgi:ABC-type transport system involved in multi-copper enzyme maturation permease subunit
LLAGILLVVAVILGVLPGPQDGSGVEKKVGYFLLPWGACAGLLSLLFFVPFVRNETDPKFRDYGLFTLLFAGGAMAVASVVGGIVEPDTLVGIWLIVALLGLGFVAAYLSQVSTDDGLGRLAAVLLGLLGAATIAYAVGRTTWPTVLYDGPAALKDAYQKYDKWKVAARAVAVLFFLAIAAAGARGRSMPWWVRAGLAIVGLGFAGVFVLGSFDAPRTNPPNAFLVPAGLVLVGIGLADLLVALAAASDAQIVVLTRRELAAFFFSPIAYLVVFAFAFIAWIGYVIFVNGVMGRGGAIEPILPDYWGATVGGVFGILILVPIVTMRAFSEERRLGTLEVLLTAPVNEPVVVLSKFLATWVFFLFALTPIGLYLIALRVESGSFDYRPLLSYYLAMGACGAGFIAFGLFCSSLTKDQIIAAVLTFAFLFVAQMAALIANVIRWVPSGIKGVLVQFNFYTQWEQALGGQLALTTVLVHLSMAVFWLFLTVKVLEARKWS